MGKHEEEPQAEIVDFSATRQDRLPYERLTDSELDVRIARVGDELKQLGIDIPDEDAESDPFFPNSGEGSKPDLKVVPPAIDPLALKIFAPVFDALDRKAREKEILSTVEEKSNPSGKVLKLPQTGRPKKGEGTEPKGK